MMPKGGGGSVGGSILGVLFVAGTVGGGGVGTVSRGVVGTACPYCMIMLDDAVKQRQADGVADESTQVLDVAQILERSAGAETPHAATDDDRATATARPQGDGGG